MDERTNTQFDGRTIGWTDSLMIYECMNLSINWLVNGFREEGDKLRGLIEKSIFALICMCLYGSMGCAMQTIICVSQSHL